MKSRNVKSAVRPSSSAVNQKDQYDLRELTPRFSKRADDWLLAGDWLAAGEKIKTHRPLFKSS